MTGPSWPAAAQVRCWWAGHPWCACSSQPLVPAHAPPQTVSCPWTTARLPLHEHAAHRCCCWLRYQLLQRQHRSLNQRKHLHALGACSRRAQRGPSGHNSHHAGLQHRADNLKPYGATVNSAAGWVVRLPCLGQQRAQLLHQLWAAQLLLTPHSGGWAGCCAVLVRWLLPGLAEASTGVLTSAQQARHGAGLLEQRRCGCCSSCCCSRG
jgi:hypothetical protein